jgi:cobalt/nickel transport protein
MMIRTAFLVTLFITGFAGQAIGHFGMVIPSENITTPQKKNVQLSLSFSHPFEGIGMDLTKPEKFFMVMDGIQTDLSTTLQQDKVMDHAAWQSDVEIKRPGVYWFVMEPKPYWEPAEDIFIIHYSKTVVAAFGADQGWDQPVGLATEIIPLLRPFGNFVGNSFTGRVLLKGKPVANTEVEVEFYNKDMQIRTASDYHVTQVIKTDDNGIFTFTCPLPGWWGFAALNKADYTLKAPDGTDKGVELGAILWVYFDEYKTQ